MLISFKSYGELTLVGIPISLLGFGGLLGGFVLGILADQVFK